MHPRVESANKGEARRMVERVNDLGAWSMSRGVRRSMQGNRGRDTKPELAIRREVHRRGLRYFVDRAPLQGFRRRADLVFPRVRVAVFVDGCFWHGCPKHHTVAKTNAAFWAEKVRLNRSRDLETTETLMRSGWMVLRIWEHEDVMGAADRIEAAVRGYEAGG